MPFDNHPDAHDSPEITALRRFADTFGLELHLGHATQREPENVVSLQRTGGAYGSIIRTMSRDSVDTAALYLIRNLQALGIDIQIEP